MASGLALVVFGWLQVAAVFFLNHPAEHARIAQLPAVTPEPSREPPARRFSPTAVVPSPANLPATKLSPGGGEQMQPFKTFAEVIYPELSDPRSPIGKASGEVVSEWSARSNSKRVLTLPKAPLAVAIEAAKRSGVKPKNFADIRTAQGLPVQILAIYKRREDRHIMAFYGLNADNTAWALSPTEAVNQVQQGIRSFFSQGEGSPVEIIVAQNPTGDYFLETAANGEESDDLLTLPNLASP